MKLSTKRNAIASALALTGLFMYTGSAQADTVQADLLTLAGSGVQFSRDAGTSWTGTTSGLWTFHQDSGPLSTYNDPSQNVYKTDLFVAFCIDLANGIGVPSNNNVWNVVELKDAANPPAGPMGSRATDLAKLLGGAISTGVLNDARNLNSTEVAALQIAVWEVSNETAGSYSLNAGNVRFQDAGVAVTDQANAYLTGIGSATAMGGLKGLTSGQQDFVGQVPIPAAAWLFGSAILGTVALGRRKLKEGAEA